MTLEEAKLILKTYTPPLTPEQIEKFKEALHIVSTSWTSQS